MHITPMNDKMKTKYLFAFRNSFLKIDVNSDYTRWKWDSHLPEKFVFSRYLRFCLDFWPCRKNGLIGKIGN